MNYLGYGTYKSCQVALTFFKHVNNVGEQSQLLKRAFTLVQQGKNLQGAILYMELAEMGFGVASLNFALLLERVDIFQTDRTFLGELAFSSLSESFNINRQIAIKYLQFATYTKETETEASLKIAEFFYYGTSGLQSYPEAIRLYKIVEDTSSRSNIRSHALYQLGIVHQFGEGVPTDNQMA